VGGIPGRDPNPQPKPRRRHEDEGDPNSFGFAVWQLKEGEDKMIADRLVEIFSAAKQA
jgi:L-seryl-tRNA(Ser) seleniumtransferase